MVGDFCKNNKKKFVGNYRNKQEKRNSIYIAFHASKEVESGSSIAIEVQGIKICSVLKVIIYTYKVES
ncbi:hypothetical protein AMR72_11280 [Flavobacterium psychrophilum]|nr:hypothetical protein AMR72_11280 [Flavobacterium psychrophilum]AOE53046.1 hypothetical protein ALW18_11270 [Flavobacterium psychrophilum]